MSDTSIKLRKWDQKIIDYLEDYYPQFRSPTYIGEDVRGIGFHSSWASPKCKHLVKTGLIERNDKGHYRLKLEKIL